MGKFGLSVRMDFMWGWVFILLSSFLGYLMYEKFLREEIRKAIDGREGGFEILEWSLMIPSSLLIGVMLAGWLVYLVSLVFAGTGESLLWGNLAVMGGLGVLVVGFLFLNRGWLGDCWRVKINKKWRGKQLMYLGLVVGLLIFSSWLMWLTFQGDESSISIGRSVHGDFGPHLSLIRSFSKGNNFPSWYPHFAGSDIKYHFLFDFFVGNLEFLGMDIVWAFNVMSALCLGSFLLLLFNLAVLLSGRAWVGLLSLVLLVFRSSLSGVESLIVSKGGWLQIDQFAASTIHEEWGLWNLNVFVNQRHLSLALGFMVLLLIWLMSSVKWDNIKQLRKGLWREGGELRLGSCMVMGMLLGLLGFWNGAVVITCLLLVGGLMIFSEDKWRLGVMLVIAGGVVYLSKMYFMSEGGGLHLAFRWGFLADEGIMGFMEYYVKLLGLMPFIFVLSILILPKRMWLFWLISWLPFVFANSVSMTVDINVNHKYVLMAVYLANMAVAYFIDQLLRGGRWVGRVLGGVILMQLLLTGVVDVVALVNANQSKVIYKRKQEVYEWVLENTESGEVFLTDDDVLNYVLLAGRPIYYGWPYYAWSAGYDTRGRMRKWERMYEMRSGEKLSELMKGEGINYVVYQDEDRGNERVIAEMFSLVMSDDYKQTRIYRVE